MTNNTWSTDGCTNALVYFLRNTLKFARKKTVKNNASHTIYLIEWDIWNKSNVNANPKDEEQGAEAHEHGGNQRHENLFDNLTGELCGGDLIHEEPKTRKNALIVINNKSYFTRTTKWVIFNYQMSKLTMSKTLTMQWRKVRFPKGWELDWDRWLDWWGWHNVTWIQCPTENFIQVITFISFKKGLSKSALQHPANHDTARNESDSYTSKYCYEIQFTIFVQKFWV